MCLTLETKSWFSLRHFMEMLYHMPIQCPLGTYFGTSYAVWSGFCFSFSFLWLLLKKRKGRMKKKFDSKFWRDEMCWKKTFTIILYEWIKWVALSWVHPANYIFIHRVIVCLELKWSKREKIMEINLLIWIDISRLLKFIRLCLWLPCCFYLDSIYVVSFGRQYEFSSNLSDNYTNRLIP